MYEPCFQHTDALISMIGRIEAARVAVLRAPIAAGWEAQLRHEALIRSAHHSTSIKGNPLSLQHTITHILVWQGGEYPAGGEGGIMWRWATSLRSRRGYDE